MRLNFDPEIVLRMAISGIKGGEGNKGEDRPTGLTGGPRYLRHLGKLTSLRLGLEMLKAGNSVKKLVWRLFLVSSWCGQNPGPGEKTSFLLQQPPPPPPLSQTTSLCITLYPTLSLRFILLHYLYFKIHDHFHHMPDYEISQQKREEIH